MSFRPGSTGGDDGMILGLPDGIRGCLFDLDGVLTKTAAVHNAAWKEMFDSYLRERARQTGQQFVPFDPVRDYDEYVDGKPRADGTRSFLASRGIDLPDGSDDDPPDAQTVHGLGNRKNEILLRRIRQDGVQAYEGSVRYVRAAPGRGVIQRELPRRPRRGGHRGPVRGADRRHRGQEGAPAGQARAGYVPGRRARARAGAGRGGGLRGCAGRRGGGPGRPVRLRGGGRPGRAGGRAEGTRRRHRGVRSRRPDGPAVIRQGVFTVEPWCLRETALDLNLLAQTESVFALSNGHLGWREI